MTRRRRKIFFKNLFDAKKKASPLPPEQLHSSAVTRPGARRTQDHGFAIRWIRLSARAISEIKSAGGNFAIKRRRKKVTMIRDV